MNAFWAGVLPWAVAAIALAALIALVAGQRIGGRTAQTVDAPQNALPQAGLDDRGATAGGGRPPDLSAMTPREQADRLFDRIMRLESEGKMDSAQFFAQMAMAVYQQIPERDADVRYDLGRIAVVGGVPQLGVAEADSILAQNSHHLLGLILGATAARAAGDEARARRYDERLRADAPAERARKLPEYQRHQADIDSTLAQLRRRATH